MMLPNIFGVSVFAFLTELLDSLGPGAWRFSPDPELAPTETGEGDAWAMAAAGSATFSVSSAKMADSVGSTTGGFDTTAGSGTDLVSALSSQTRSTTMLAAVTAAETAATLALGTTLKTGTVLVVVITGSAGCADSISCSWRTSFISACFLSEEAAGAGTDTAMGLAFCRESTG